MASYVFRRFFLMLITLFGVSIIIFVLLRVLPGSIADILLEASGHVDPEQKARIERDLGLDGSIIEQYLKWIFGLFQGNLGFSYITERPASEEILSRLPVTGKLALLALIFSVIIGVPLGVISAVKQNSMVDNFLRVLSISALSLPSFWLALLILMASVHLFGSIPIYRASDDRGLLSELLLLSIPAAAVGFRSSALVMRLTRSSMLEVLRQDYIRTARSKGASEGMVNYHHALKNAMLPVVTIIGIEAAFLVGGLVITETVFNIPGIARYLVESIQWRDYPIVQNLVILIAVVVLVVNFTVDILYAILDPRIRISD